MTMWIYYYFNIHATIFMSIYVRIQIKLNKYICENRTGSRTHKQQVTIQIAIRGIKNQTNYKNM